jgi:arabinofuranosyltransferase
LRGVRALLLLVFLVIVLRHGWMTDDAYISLRTLDNLFGGHGLVWNVGERVQSFTHPLWLALCALVFAITREFFYSLMVFGALMSVAAMAILTVKIARSELVAISLILAAILSHAFVDYSTSGLENPLTHVLLGLSAWVYLGRVPGTKRFMGVCLLGGLALLSRPDNAVLLGPMVIAAGIQAHRRGARLIELLRAAAIGGLPLWGWELFSLVYYGALVPNTALAKLNAGIPATERAAQGLVYLVATLDADPLTLVIIAAGMLVPFVLRDRRMLPLAIGIALHLLYVIEIGGDFMAGRFLTAPMFMAMLCLARVRLGGSALALSSQPLIPLAIVNAVVLLLGLSARPNTFEINSKLSPPSKSARTSRDITDERAFFYEDASLVHAYRLRDMPDHVWWIRGLRGAPPGKRVQLAVALGYRGVAGGPEVHWLDKTALSDPLLARMPAKYRPDWMTGHLFRAIPKGYVETLETGENQLVDADVRELYDRIALVTRGDLWSVERFRAIVWLNTGGPKRLLDRERWRFQGASRRTPASLAARVADGTPFESKQVRSFPAEGVRVQYKQRQHRRQVEIAVNGDDRFELRFYDGRDEIARVAVPRRLSGVSDGVVARRLDLPKVVEERGFTLVRILPRTKRRSKSPHWAIGQLIFDDDPASED